MHMPVTGETVLVLNRRRGGGGSLIRRPRTTGLENIHGAL